MTGLEVFELSFSEVEWEGEVAGALSVFFAVAFLFPGFVYYLPVFVS